MGRAGSSRRMVGWALLRYRLLPITSRVIPERALGFLMRHWNLGHDESDGWNYWLDVSYWRYVRRDRRRNPEMYTEDTYA